MAATSSNQTEQKPIHFGQCFGTHFGFSNAVLCVTMDFTFIDYWPHWSHIKLHELKPSGFGRCLPVKFSVKIISLEIWQDIQTAKEVSTRNIMIKHYQYLWHTLIFKPNPYLGPLKQPPHAATSPQPQPWASPTAAACSAPATPSFGVGMGATSTCTADVLGSNSSNEVSMAMRGMKTVPWIHGFFQFFNEHSNIDQGSKFRGTVLENCMYCGPKGISSCLDVWSSHRAVVEPWLNHLSCTKESPPCFKWIQTWGYTHIHQTIPSFHQTFIASHFYISSNVIHHIPKKMQ